MKTPTIEEIKIIDTQEKVIEKIANELINHFFQLGGTIGKKNYDFIVERLNALSYFFATQIKQAYNQGIDDTIETIENGIDFKETKKAIEKLRKI